MTVLPIEGPGRADDSSAVADRDELERAFRRLTIEQRAVFVLHHYLGLPLVEVAELLGDPRGNRPIAPHYAIAGLRQALDGRAGADRPGRTTRMTDDRSLERAARSWLEEGPTRAPDRPVDTALARIQTTHQERDLRVPWRLPSMNRIPRSAVGAAVVVLLVVGFAIFALGRGPNFGVQGTPNPTVPIVTPTPTPAAAIAAGTYRVDLPVADILTALDAETTLNAQEKDAVIDGVLGIRGAEVLHLVVVVEDGTFTVLQGTDRVDDVPQSPVGDDGDR